VAPRPTCGRQRRCPSQNRFHVSSPGRKTEHRRHPVRLSRGKMLPQPDQGHVHRRDNQLGLFRLAQHALERQDAQKGFPLLALATTFREESSTFVIEEYRSPDGPFLVVQVIDAFIKREILTGGGFPFFDLVRYALGGNHWLIYSILGVSLG